MAVRAFPALLPFFILTELPDLAETIWRGWLANTAAYPAVLELTLATTLGELIVALAVAGGWGIIVPVVVAEGGGPFGSMARAWRLLSGNRWRLVALYAVVIVIGALPSTIATVLVVPISETLHLAGKASSYFRTEIQVAGALGLIVTAVWRVMVGVAYLELRRVKEGVSESDIAEIFA
jgi:hypothetical protein